MIIMSVRVMKCDLRAANDRPYEDTRAANDRPYEMEDIIL